MYIIYIYTPNTPNKDLIHPDTTFASNNNYFSLAFLQESSNHLRYGLPRCSIMARSIRPGHKENLQLAESRKGTRATHPLVVCPLAVCLWSTQNTGIFAQRTLRMVWLCMTHTYSIAQHYVHCTFIVPFGFVWKCWVNIPNEIAIFHRDNDQQNHWVNRGTNHFQTHPFKQPWSCGNNLTVSERDQATLRTPTRAASMHHSWKASSCVGSWKKLLTLACAPWWDFAASW